LLFFASTFLTTFSSAEAKFPTSSSSTALASVSRFQTSIGSAYPLADEEVQVKNGNEVIKVRPLKKTKTADGKEALAERVLVRFKDGVSDPDKTETHKQAAKRKAGKARPLAEVLPQLYMVDVSGAASLDEAVQSYLADSRVKYAQPDYILQPTGTPDDPSFSSQWGMAKISAPLAWNLTTGSPQVRIAILDTGINAAHPDLIGKVALEANFTTSTSTSDLFNHGTHVAGIAAAATNNRTGVAGVGYNSSLLNVKVLDDAKGEGTTSTSAQGIYWAAAVGANVINMSYGYGRTEFCDPTEQEAITYAWNRNVVLVASAGDHGNADFTTPASCANVISVANTDSNDKLASSSTFGPWVKVAAPGTYIYSTINSGGYASFSGTSMAAPHVSGLAALMRSLPRCTSAQSIVDNIYATADAISGTGINWLYGRINANYAVSNCAQGWLNWESLGGQLTSAPSVSSWGAGRLDVFAKGVNNDLQHKWFDASQGKWSGWESLGGQLTSAPAVSSWGAGRIDVFTRGANNDLRHKWFDANQGGWSGWESLGGNLASDPAAVSWGAGRIDVFAKGANNDLQHKWYNYSQSGWSGWESLGGQLTSAPAVSSWGAGRLDVFYKGVNNDLQHRSFDVSQGIWSGSESLGGQLASGPGAVSWGAGRIDVFVKGVNNDIQHKWYVR
jgi:subtilisin family serine protease